MVCPVIDRHTLASKQSSWCWNRCPRSGRGASGVEYAAHLLLHAWPGVCCRQLMRRPTAALADRPPADQESNSWMHVADAARISLKEPALDAPEARPNAPCPTNFARSAWQLELSGASFNMPALYTSECTRSQGTQRQPKLLARGRSCVRSSAVDEHMLRRPLDRRQRRVGGAEATAAARCARGQVAARGRGRRGATRRPRPLQRRDVSEPLHVLNVLTTALCRCSSRVDIDCMLACHERRKLGLNDACRAGARRCMQASLHRQFPI